MTQKQQTYYMLSAVFLIFIAIVVVLVIPEPASSNGDDSVVSSGNPGEVITRQEGYEAATIIIVDDFEGQLNGFIEEFKEKKDEDGFADAAAQLREYGTPVKGEGVEEENQYKDAVLDQFANLEAVYGAEANNLLAARLGGEEAIDRLNCALATEGASIFDMEGTSIFDMEGTSIFDMEGTGATPADVSHGERVKAEFDYLDGKYGGRVTIDFTQVDISGFSMAQVADEIATRINTIWEQDSHRPIVVNMSFALVPCRSVPSIAIYAALLAEFDPELDEDLAWMRETFRAILDTEILREGLAGKGTFDDAMCAESEMARAVGMCDPGEERPPVFFVGASGNGTHVDPPEQRIGAEYPFFPAAWSEVIAISGNMDDADFLTEPPRADWSNAGLILMPGRWRWQSSDFEIDHVEIGTSFAAPRYSYMVALYLTNAPEDIGCGSVGAIPGPVQGHDWVQEPNPPRQDEPPRCP